jgi:hypothetical protein
MYPQMRQFEFAEINNNQNSIHKLIQYHENNHRCDTQHANDL